MEKEKNIKLGIFVVLGSMILIVSLYLIGNNKGMFDQSFTLYATFKNVNGLQTGNNVRYAGIDIGTVDQIEITNDTTVKVKMSISTSLKSVIRKNCLTSVGTDGLMGNKLINIEPGNTQFSLVEDGDELQSVPAVNTEDMLRTLDFTNDNVATISTNLKNITDKVYKSQGTLYTVLMDSSLAGNLKNTLHNIETVSNNLTKITNDLSSMTSELKQGKGLLGSLLNDTIMKREFQESISLVKSSGEKVNSAANDFKIIMEKINNNNGSFSTLLNDTTTANHLKQSMIEIENSARNFNLNMEALKNSFLFHGYFKKQINKK